MGLDTTHGCWHGAYSAFARWRFKLAEIAEIPYGLMEGSFGWQFHDDDAADLLKNYKGPNLSAFHDLVRNSVGCLPIKWSSLKPDPLHVLLNHSDCEGELEAKDCGPLADRLTELLPLLPEGEASGHIGNWREKTQTFIDGLRLAAANNENVDFH